MASILKVDDLRGNTSAGDITITSEGGAATQSLQHGLNKCWLNFESDITTPAIRDSLNVSSLDDIGTGRYRVNYSNNFNAAKEYAGGGMTVRGGNSKGAFVALDSQGNINFATNGTSISVTRSDNTLADQDIVSMLLTGDLA